METERLLLRRFEEKDLDDLYEYLSDETVLLFEPQKSLTKAETKENLDWRITTEEMIAVELKKERKVIGNVYLGNRDFNSKELGFVFNRNYWKKGYAREACSTIIKNAFENGVHRIYAECDPKNVNSWKLLESLGFCRSAYFERNVYFWTDEKGNPIWKDTFVYSLLNKEYN